MLAYNIRHILELVPEVKEMIKKADIEQEFPMDSKDSVIASYLRANYLMKVAHKPVDPITLGKLEKAANLYGVKEKLDTFLPRFKSLEKSASTNVEKELRELESMFEGDTGGFGFLTIEKAAEKAEELYKQYGEMIKSAEVKRYACVGWLNKEAAIRTLANRYYANKDSSFVKIARLVSTMREDDVDSLKKLCNTVTQLDKKAGFDLIGFNFYREAVITKEAALITALRINLAGEDVPYEKIAKFGKDRIGSTLGADIASSLTGNPVEDKAVLESLPRDLQIMLKSLVKGI